MIQPLTLADRLKSQDIAPESIDTAKLKECMQSKGINPIGYTHVDDRHVDLYAADDGFDIAFNGCIADLTGEPALVKLEIGEKIEELPISLPEAEVGEPIATKKQVSRKS